MKALTIVVAIASTMAGTWWVAQAQNAPRPAQRPPHEGQARHPGRRRQGAPARPRHRRRPLRQQRRGRHADVPAGRAGGQGQQRRWHSRPPGAVNQGPFDPTTWKYGPAFDAAGRRQDLEPGEG